MNTTPTIGNINAEIEKKQDKENVYTKAEVNTALDQKVNKTNPTVNGTLTMQNNAIVRNVLNSSLNLYGGNAWNTGAYIQLGGKDNASNKGNIIMSANDGTNSASIELKPNGTTSCPTPPANDNSTKIATTAWCNMQSVYVPPISECTEGTVNNSYHVPTQYVGGYKVVGKICYVNVEAKKCTYKKGSWPLFTNFPKPKYQKIMSLYHTDDTLCANFISSAVFQNEFSGALYVSTNTAFTDSNNSYLIIQGYYEIE